MKEFDLPSTCNRLGARGEYMFGKSAPVIWADVDAHTLAFRAMCAELFQ